MNGLMWGVVVGILWVAAGIAVGVLIHWREEAYRPLRRQPETPWPKGSRHYDSGLWL